MRTAGGQCYFADDLALYDNDRERLERRLEIWREKMEAAGLKISQKKTEHFPAVGDQEHICLNVLSSSTWAEPSTKTEVAARR